MKRVAFTLALALAFARASGGAYAQFVDLGSSPVFVRVGFDEAWLERAPRVDDPAWTVLPPTEGKRALEMRSLGLPGAPGGGTWSLLSREPVEYTVIMPFQAGYDLLSAGDPALYLRHVGQQWAVYLNGVLLRDEFVRSGSRLVERSLRDALVPLDTRRLARGDNVLAFRLRGDPVDDRTGFNRAGPYVIGSYRALSAGNSEFLMLMFIGVYAFFALYHGALYAMRPRESSNLFFCLSALLVALYLWSRTGVATGLAADTAILRRLEYSSLFLSLPAITAFLESVLRPRRSLFTRGIAVACALLVALGFFLRLEPLLQAWYALALAGIAYSLGPVVGGALVAEFRARKAGASPVALARALIASPPGRVALGGLTLGAAVAADVWLVAAVGGSVSYTGYAFFAFIMLAATVPAERFSAMRARVEAMNAGLEAEVEARTASLSSAAAERARLNDELSDVTARLSAMVKEAERDMRAAAAVQRGFYAARPPSDAAWDVASVFEPVAGVSSDFYDFYRRDEALAGLSLGRVSGEGIGSGLLAVLVRNIMARGMLDADDAPLPEALDAINRALVRELSASGATVGCVTLRLEGESVACASMGHAPPLLRSALDARVSVVGGASGRNGTGGLAPNGKAAGPEPLASPALGRDDFAVSIATPRLRRGDALLAYSPGLAAGGADGDVAGLRRLADAFSKADDSSAESILASVMLDYKNRVPMARRKDDVAAIVLLRR